MAMHTVNTHISKSYIAQFLSSYPTILEAGAHIGRDTIKMAQQWPNAIIHAFEPIPYLFEELKKNTAHFANIHRYNVALSNESGFASFYQSGGRSTATSSLLVPTGYLKEHPTTTFETISVPTITLDQWAKKNNISHVDFMWLDMQGAELLALQAGINLLKSVKAIYCEVSFQERYENNPLSSTIKNWLGERGFLPIKEDIRNKSWGNILFIKS